MIQKFKKHHIYVFYLFACALAVASFFCPDKIEAIARSFVLLLGVGI